MPPYAVLSVMQFRGWWESWGDLLLALGLTAAAEAQFWFSSPEGLEVVGGRGLGAVVLAVSTLPIAWRRSRPVPTLLVANAARLAAVLMMTHYPNGGPLAPFLAVIVAFYSVGAYGEGRPAAWSAVSVLAILGILDLASSTLRLDDGVQPGASLALGLAWLVGGEIRRRRRAVAELREKASRLEAEREEKAKIAVSQERGRIARELHDVVAHSVSVMVVQAQAGPRLLKDGAAVADAFQAIEAAGREALVELRRLLGVLRTDNERAVVAPQPGLASLDGLLEHVRASGVPVSLRSEGEPVALPAGMDLAAFRIVQEALTNTIKHAGGARSTVVLRYNHAGLEIHVVDDGTAATGDDAVAGHGVIGMRERVALYGGRLEIGPCAGTGYQVRAWLPTNGTAT